MKTTPSSFASRQRSELKSSQDSRRLSEKDGQEERTIEERTTETPGELRRVPGNLMDLALDGRRAQFVPPSTAWCRPIGLTNLAALHTTSEDDSNPFWPRS